MTKAQQELLQYLRQPNFLLRYDTVNAKASLTCEGVTLRTIPFKTYLAIKPHLEQVPNENYSSLKFYKAT